MTAFAILALALVLDATFGEPDWLWNRVTHPAVLMGRLVKALDQRLNKGRAKKLKGITATLTLVVTGLAAGIVLSIFGPVVEILVATVLLAQRSLCDHVLAVAKGLDTSLEEGRKNVAMIVSRDTGDMSEPEVVRSAIESGAENMSDGVIAPAFWFLVAGLPGLVAYKLINTADSMIGYHNERYRDFGWAAARLDDVLNLIPARLTALLMAIVTGQTSRFAQIRVDAGKHRSPNAGWPEAAMAYAIQTALAGPRSYDGVMQDFAWVNDAGSKDGNADNIRRTTRVLWKTWALALAVTSVLAVVMAVIL